MIAFHIVLVVLALRLSALICGRTIWEKVARTVEVKFHFGRFQDDCESQDAADKTDIE